MWQRFKCWIGWHVPVVTYIILNPEDKDCQYLFRWTGLAFEADKIKIKCAVCGLYKHKNSWITNGD